jgi:hypothetical protein
MPQNPTISPNAQSWENMYVAIYKCSPRDQKVTEIVVADKTKIAANADLTRVLGVLQQGMISKREYPGALRPTIRYATFQKPQPKTDNNGQKLLDALLQAKTDDVVRRSASDLANRYITIKNVQKGVLIFLLSSLNSKNCVFIFKCDFEDISQLTPKQIFRRVEDAFEEQAKKAAQYPYFDGRKFDLKTVRVFDALGETQYWLNFLELVLPPSQSAQQRIALMSSLSPRLIEEYGETLKSVSKERSLADDERLVKGTDLLPHREVLKVIKRQPDTKVTLSLDGSRVTAPLKDYGHKWMHAVQEGTYYILIKGAKLEVHGEGPSAIDMASVVNLSQAASELKMRLA